jgi:phosphate-selective porin OprO and OprP
MRRTTFKQGKNGMNLTKVFKLGFAGLTVLASTSVFAQGAPVGDFPIERIEEIKETKGKGWQLSSEGGLSYINPQDERYWFALGGTIRLDEVIFSGSYRDTNGQFPNSAHARLIQPSLEGGVGEHWTYGMDLQFLSLTRPGASFKLQDTFLAYDGFTDNSQLFVGRLSGNWFGLDGSNSGSWLAFMERSAQAAAFYPGDGIGVMGDMWWSHGAVTMLALQPDQGRQIVTTDTPNGLPVKFRNDRWTFIARATIAPINECNDVWHFGASFAYRQNDSTLSGVRVADFNLAGLPGNVVARNYATPRTGGRSVVNTGELSVSYARQMNVEAARQIGPFMLEGEYSDVYVHRVGDPQGSGRFSGFNIQTRYMLTGESHAYDVRDGNFGKVVPCSKYGAVEIAARYDYLNLGDKNIYGGSQQDWTLGVNWFVNTSLRLTANYVRADIRPNLRHGASNSIVRHLDVFGFRAQIRFK